MPVFSFSVDLVSLCGRAAEELRRPQGSPWAARNPREKSRLWAARNPREESRLGM